MFFVAKTRPPTHHVSPHISPRSHHKNTTFCTHFFPKHPSKTAAKTTKPRLTPGSRFFRKNNPKKPSLPSQELPSSQQGHSPAPPPPELALVRRPQPAGAAHGSPHAASP